jgi:hypothetical protein
MAHTHQGTYATVPKITVITKCTKWMPKVTKVEVVSRELLDPFT